MGKMISQIANCNSIPLQEKYSIYVIYVCRYQNVRFSLVRDLVYIGILVIVVNFGFVVFQEKKVMMNLLGNLQKLMIVQKVTSFKETKVHLVQHVFKPQGNYPLYYLIIFLLSFKIKGC